MAERSVVFLTQFVCHPDRLAEAESRYRRRVSEIDPAVAVVEDSDARALPLSDDFLLWELRDTAIYEGVNDVETLELFQISSRIRFEADRQEQVTEQLFFAAAEEADPFPAQVTHLPAPAPAPPHSRVGLLSEGTWLVTVYALVSRAGDAEAVFHDVCDGPDVVAASAITEVDPDDPDYGRMFGPLVIDQTRALLAGSAACQDYPAGRRRLRQRLVVNHPGPIRAVGGGAAAVTVERLALS